MGKGTTDFVRHIPSPFPLPTFGGERGRVRVRHILLICIGILIFLAPIKFGLTVEYGIHWIWRIGIVILFTLWLVWGIIIGRFRLRYSLLDIVILIFLLSAIISTFKAPNIHLAHLCLTQYIIYALTYFLILNLLEDEKDLRYLLGVLIIPCIIISIYGIYQYYIGLPETRDFASQYLDKQSLEFIKDRLESNRVFSTFIYPNTLAGYLFLCLPLAMGLKMKRWLRILVVLIMLYALYLTFYKGSGAIDKIGNTLAFRMENWSAGIRMIKEHPISGVGTYNFSVFYPLYKLDIAEEVREAHNNFLQVWTEQGIFGFLSFCLIWFIAIKKGFKMKWLAMGLVAFLIHNLVDFDWYVPGLTIIAWAFIGVIIWAGKGYKERVFKINRWLGLAIILPSFILVLIHLERGFVTDYYLEKAKEAFNKKNYPMAEVLTKSVINMDKDNPEPYFLLGKLCVYKMDYTNSIEWYKKALKYNPYSSSYYYNMGLSYIYQDPRTFGSYILDAFKKAVEFYPTNPFYHLQLAQVYETNSQQGLALREYNYCLELNDKIEEECKTRGKMLKHLLLQPGVIEEVKGWIKKYILIKNTLQK